MMLPLYLEVSQYAIQLTRTNGKGCITALPEKVAIAQFKRLDPFRGRFLYRFSHLGLRNSARQCRYDVDVIGNSGPLERLRPPKSRQIVAK
jgi:hypothetical protein